MKLIKFILQYTLLALILYLVCGAVQVYKEKPATTITETNSFGLYEACIYQGGTFSDADAGEFVHVTCSISKTNE